MLLYKNVLSRLWNLSSESNENMKGRGEGGQSDRWLVPVG